MVQRLALLAQRCGLDGVVCSALEAVSLREVTGEDFVWSLRVSDHSVTVTMIRRGLQHRQWQYVVGPAIL